MHFATRHAVRCFVLCFALWFGALEQSRAAAQYTLLHGFTGAPADGANPQFSALATDGTMLYGVTFNGGITNKGTLFKINTNGSGYQILHSFTGLSLGSGNASDGANPNGTPLLIGSTLYGTTVFGGTNSGGTIFRINTDGSGFALLHSFGASGSDGIGPYCTLATDGTNLFGTA